MDALIRPENKLDPGIVKLVEALARKRAVELVDEMRAQIEKETIRKTIKSFTVRNHTLNGIGAQRAVRVIEAVNNDMTTEDPEEVWRHIDTHLAQMGLEFYEKEVY